MISVLGREVEDAASRLKLLGKTVRMVPVKSRKGVLGNEKRVIRQREMDDHTVELVYAVFKTEI